MLMLSLVRAATVLLPWMLHLAKWLAARSLNVPDPVVHDASVFVFAQVQAVENKAARTLCPRRLLRQFHTWCRKAAG